MALRVFPYEYFIQNSMKLNRSEYKLPEYSQKLFDDVKRKLNIKKELSKESIIKPTTLGKQEEVIAKLFKYFNKITDKTYDKLSIEVFSIISLKNSDKEKICVTFFRVILNNSFFCHLYAKLYKGFIEISSEFIDVLQIQTSQYVEQIKKITYVSPTEDYDKYCDYVKQVEGIKNFTNFLIQCLKQKIIQGKLLLDLAITFQNCCLHNIDIQEKLLLNEIYISNVAIIIIDTYEIICKNKTWSQFNENHRVLIGSKGNGMNKKIHFKLLDITEQLGV
tara:strand:- start:1230 stop:2060 length:831 start_codon:yes stop_codon:yes gene_type:complete